MNKTGHLFITKNISDNIERKYRPFLLLGSILPDILVYTYLTGHTINSSFDKIKRKMINLEERERINWYSYIELGYLLHYIEDYFTYPHNTGFKGTLAEHCRYEKQMFEYLFLKAEEGFETFENEAVMSSKELCECISKMHEKYTKEFQCYENDIKYIIAVSQKVVSCFSLIFKRNQSRLYSIEAKQEYVLQGLFFVHRHF